ncbi:AAA family ATPase [Methylococcus sp. EFPC2]|uniref:AAA family ATPase n=1 Tax=Methylococcus sp. EFPC2 TaxID=2812648 RepID=UPI001968379C|nr:AAA family ATPase [Methylococcus sp. EFPC2]QSA98815.1 AAA family ATPase [Methylococcus sp. EFPC2]
MSNTTKGDQIAHILEHLPIEYATDYSLWLSVLMAIHSGEHEHGYDGAALVVAFSQRCPDKFDERAVRQRYESFKEKPGGVTLGTLYSYAQREGITYPGIAEDDEWEGSEFQPSPEFRKQIKEYEALPSGHPSPYFEDKCLLTTPHDEFKVDDEGCTWLPYRRFADGCISAIQKVPPPGSAEGKKFVPGSNVKGAGWSSTKERYQGDLYSLPTYLVESAGNKLAASAALPKHQHPHESGPDGVLLTAQAMAVGSTSNFESATRTLLRQDPTRPIIWVVDRDYMPKATEQAQRIPQVRLADFTVEGPAGHPDNPKLDIADIFKADGLVKVRQVLATACHVLPERAQGLSLKVGEVQWMLKEVPAPQRFIVPDVLRVDDITGVIAPGGAGKSQVLLQLLSSAATGLPWFDVVPMGAQCLNSLGIFLEDHIGDTHRRLRQVVREMQKSFADLPEPERLRRESEMEAHLTQNLRLFPLSGRQAHIMTVQRGEPREGQFLQEVIELVQESEADLLVIEPLARLHMGEENNQTHMTFLVSLLERIRKETGVCVVTAHHVSKGATTNNSRNQASARGASAIVDAMRHVLQLSRMDDADINAGLCPRGDDPSKYLQLASVKCNHLPPRDAIWLERVPGGYLRGVSLQPAANNMTALNAVVDLVGWTMAQDALLTRAAFEKAHAGRAGTLGMGQKSLRELITLGIQSGKLGLKAAGGLTGLFRRSAAAHRPHDMLLVKP